MSLAHKSERASISGPINEPESPNFRVLRNNRAFRLMGGTSRVAGLHRVWYSMKYSTKDSSGGFEGQRAGPKEFLRFAFEKIPAL